MSATSKHITSTSSTNLIKYLRGEVDENGVAPRPMFEQGRHCYPSAAIEQFRELRQEHGREGEVRRVSGSYERPETPADATHLKVGKNWRAAKPGELATHVRIEPEVAFEKRSEAVHFIYSFDLATVNPDDTQGCRNAFDAVVAFREEYSPGTQSLFVAHGDAKGSRDARERREGGKFHVHEAMNAVVHSRMTVGDRTYEPGMRVGGAITDVNSYRSAWDEFLERRGHEFGLAPQDASVLPAPGSKQAREVARNNHDFWTRERGGISDHDRARRGIETALETLSKDPARVAGRTAGERTEVLADEVATTGDVELKLRSTRQAGSRVRSFVVPGRPAPIGGTKLGERYSNAGLDEQLELVAQGRWQPYERGRVTQPAKTFEPLSAQEEAQLWAEVQRVAKQEQAQQLQEQGATAATVPTAPKARETAAQMYARAMAGTPATVPTAPTVPNAIESAAERYARAMAGAQWVEPDLAAVAAGWQRDALTDTEQAAPAAEIDSAAEVPVHVAENDDVDATDLEATSTSVVVPDSAGVETSPVASTAGTPTARAADDAQVAATQPQPQAARRSEKQLSGLTAEQMRDRELVAVVWGDHEGATYLDVQMAAHDVVARDRTGLHLYAQSDQNRVTVTRPYSQEQADKLRAAAGDNSTIVDGREVLAVRGSFMPAMAGKGYVLNANSLEPSAQHIGPDVLDKQRESEDRARERTKTKGKSRADSFSETYRESARTNDHDITD